MQVVVCALYIYHALSEGEFVQKKVAAGRQTGDQIHIFEGLHPCAS